MQAAVKLLQILAGNFAQLLDPIVGGVVCRLIRSGAEIIEKPMLADVWIPRSIGGDGDVFAGRWIVAVVVPPHEPRVLYGRLDGVETSLPRLRGNVRKHIDDAVDRPVRYAAGIVQRVRIFNRLTRHS